MSGDAVAGSDVSEVKWVTGQELTGLGLRESIERVVKKAIAQTSEGMHPES